MTVTDNNGSREGAQNAPAMSTIEANGPKPEPDVDSNSNPNPSPNGLANGHENENETNLQEVRNEESGVGSGGESKIKIPLFRLPSNPFAKKSSNSGEIDKFKKESSNKKMEVVSRLDMELKVIQDSGPPTKKGWKSFWKRTMSDMRNKNLLPIKILFFFKAATLFVLYPFLTLHIKSLGLDAAEAGINSAFIPVVAILGPPAAGIIADRIGNFKLLLSAMTFVTAGLALLLLLVPVARETVTLPQELSFAISCGGGRGNGSLVQQDLRRSQILLETVEKTVCTLDLSSAPWRQLHPSQVQCGKVCPVKNAGSGSLPPYASAVFPLHGNTTYLMPGKKLTFTPSSKRVPSLVCGKGDNVSCYFAFADLANPESAVTTTVPTEFTELKFLGTDEDVAKRNLTHVQFAIQGNFKFGTQEFNTVPACIPTGRDVPRNESYSKCVDKCLVKYNRKSFCSNTQDTIVYDVSLTFWLYTLFRIILGLGSATSWIMFEGAVLAVLKECGGDYGLQRVSALFAAIVVCPLSGALIYRFHDFRPAFYLYAVLQCFSAFLTLKIDLTFKKPAGKVLKHLKEVLSQAEILIFFGAMFLSGSAWGYLESFLFWFLKNMGGSEILMGLTISVGGLAGLPLLVCSRIIIKKIGHVSVLCLGLLFYSIRLFGYSFIENPWMCLPFEAMEAITSSLAITAAATYAAALSTEQTIASVQGFMGALYFGIGRGAGSLLGGFLIKWYGERVTFQIFAIASFVSSIIYSALNVAYIRRHTRVQHGLDLNNLRGDRFDDIGNGCISPSETSPSANTIKSSATTENKKETEIQIPTPLEANGGGQSQSQGQGVTVTSIVDPVVLPSDPFIETGGFIGPCEINQFTDVPLDEENLVECRNTIRRRPNSFPEKTGAKKEESPQRSAEN